MTRDCNPIYTMPWPIVLDDRDCCWQESRLSLTNRASVGVLARGLGRLLAGAAWHLTRETPCQTSLSRCLWRFTRLRLHRRWCLPVRLSVSLCASESLSLSLSLRSTCIIVCGICRIAANQTEPWVGRGSLWVRRRKQCRYRLLTRGRPLRARYTLRSFALYSYSRRNQTTYKAAWS